MDVVWTGLYDSGSSLCGVPTHYVIPYWGAHHICQHNAVNLYDTFLSACKCSKQFMRKYIASNKSLLCWFYMTLKCIVLLNLSIWNILPVAKCYARHQNLFLLNMNKWMLKIKTLKIKLSYEKHIRKKIYILLCKRKIINA